MKCTNQFSWKRLLLPCLILIFFTSCQKEEEQLEAPFELGEIVNMHNDELAHSFGKLLAISAKNTDVKSFVKSEVTQRFDGDYDMLLTMNVDKEAKNVQGRSTTFRSMLKNAIPSGRTESIDALIDQIQSEYPLLQISVPELDVMSAEDWDIESHTPIVAVLDHDYDDQTTSTVTAYDVEGNVSQLDALNEPDQLVIVVGSSERIVAILNDENDENGRTDGLVDPINCEHEQIALEPVYINDEYTFYSRPEYMDALNMCSGGGGGGTGGGGTEESAGCDRETNDKYDYINKAKFKDYGTIRQVETWVAGDPEVRLIIFFAFSNSSSNFNFTHLSYPMGADGWFKRKWFNEWAILKNFDYQIVRWDPQIYGDRMYYSWIEEDPGLATVNLNVSVSSTFNFLNFEIANVNANGNASFSIGGADDIIASPIEVQFCDNTDGEGTEYKTPMHFWVNQQ